ncbi:MAG: hypothetical protein AB1414_14860, partial [bacterium]
LFLLGKSPCLFLSKNNTRKLEIQAKFSSSFVPRRGMTVSPENRDSGVRGSGRLVAAGFSLISPEPSNHQTHFHLPLCPLPVGMSVSPEK